MSTTAGTDLLAFITKNNQLSKHPIIVPVVLCVAKYKRFIGPDWRRTTKLMQMIPSKLGRWQLARRGHAPRSTLCTGPHLEGRKYGILKFGRFYSELAFALPTVIFYTSYHSPVLGPHPTDGAPRPHTKQCVHQETNTADLTERSPAVIHVVYSNRFTSNGNSMFCTIHVFQNSA